MATKAETYRSEEERRSTKKSPTPPAKAKAKAKADAEAKAKAKAKARERTDVGAIHAAENEKSSPARRASDERTKAIRVRGKAGG